MRSGSLNLHVPELEEAPEESPKTLRERDGDVLDHTLQMPLGQMPAWSMHAWHLCPTVGTQAMGVAMYLSRACKFKIHCPVFT